jgi:hypothetical protein
LFHRYWLPILGLQCYVLGWLWRGVWISLYRRLPGGICPAVDAAWSEVWAALVRTRPDAREAPLFLILGPYTPELKACLEAMGASRIAPRLNASLQLFVHAEALFVVAGTNPGSRALSDPLAGEAESSETAVPLLRCCQLIQRDRSGQHALQGIVAVVPCQALQTDARMQQVTSRCREDLHAIRTAVGLECPLHVLITGQRDLPAPMAQGWFQRFPLMPDCEPAEMALMLKEQNDQLCLDTIPRMLRGPMRIDTAAPVPGTMSEVLRDNVRQYQFLASVHAWQARLNRFLAEAIRNEYDEPGFVAGCYFLSSPEAPDREHKVESALLADLLVNQQAVTWTPRTWAERERQRIATRNGYGLMLAGGVSALVVAGWFFTSRL